MATTDDHGVVRSSTTSQSPYLRLDKTQLNFFMTRTLFMQEAGADSLGAQAANARRNQLHNSSSSSMNNSASRVEQQKLKQAAGGGDDLLGYFDDGRDESEDVWVYNDNAKILPNSQAHSMPPIPFPPSGPESPRPVERKDGVRIMTPTHIPIDPLGRKRAPELPELPLSGMALDDEEEEDRKPAAVAEPMQEEESPPQVPMEEEAVEPRRQSFQGLQVFPKNKHRSVRNLATADEDKKPALVEEEMSIVSDDGGVARSIAVSRKSIASIPPRGSQVPVFPKNQRRSKRLARGDFGRSQSFGRQSDGSRSVGDEYESKSLGSSSCH